MDNSNPYQSPTVVSASPDEVRIKRRMFPRVVAAVDLVGIILFAAAFGWGVYIRSQMADNQQIVWPLLERLDTWLMLSAAVFGIAADCGILFHRRWAVPVGCVAVVLVTFRIAWETLKVASLYAGFPPVEVMIVIAVQAAWTICYFVAIRSYHSQWARTLPPYVLASWWR